MNQKGGFQRTPPMTGVTPPNRLQFAQQAAQAQQAFQSAMGGAGGYAQQMGAQQGAFNQQSAQMGQQGIAVQMGGSGGSNGWQALPAGGIAEARSNFQQQERDAGRWDGTGRSWLADRGYDFGPNQQGMGANPFARQTGAYEQQAGSMRGGGQSAYGLIGRDRGGDLWGEGGGGYGVVNPNQGLSMGPKDGAGDYVNPSIPPKTGGYQTPQENPGGVEGGYNFMTDPGYEFRVGEGTRAIERGAAARGGLLSGGTGRALQRYGQDYASNEYTNVYNRIANIAGLGQVSAGQSGQYAMYAGQGMGTAAAQGAQASAYGQQASGNAWANAANQIGQLPWGDIFKKQTYPGVPA